MSKMSPLCFILMNFGTFTDIGTFFAPKFQLESFLRWLCCSAYIHGRFLHGSPAAATSDSLFIATVIDHEQAFVVCRAICCAFHIYLVCPLVEQRFALTFIGSYTLSTPVHIVTGTTYALCLHQYSTWFPVVMWICMLSESFLLFSRPLQLFS